MAWPSEPDNHVTSADEVALDAEDALARLASDARVEDRVEQRRRLRWLRRQAEEATTFDGLVGQLVELGQPISLVTSSGGTHRGVAVLLGADAVVLRTDIDRHVVVATGAVAALDAGARPAMTREGDDGGVAAGGRPTLRELLADLAADAVEATATLVGGTSVHGRLLWIGDDVAAWALTGGGAAGREAERIRYVRLSSVVDVSFNGSG